MSGSINVASVPGKGSDFYFSIRVSKLGTQHGRSLQAEGHPDDRKALLRCISSIRVLAISKYAATIDMIRHILPGIHVDGVLEVEDFQKLVTQHKYDVIIVGLFMNHNSTSTAWLEEASKLNKNGLIIIMNYPAGGISNGKLRVAESVSNEKMHCKTVRMAVPLRRIKLLRTIGEMLNKIMPAPVTNNVRSKALPLISEEERKLFSSMHILIAEGKE